MKKAVKIILISIAVLVLLIVLAVTGIVTLANYKNSHYYEYASPVGTIEKKYTPLGSYDVSYAEYDADSIIWEKYEIWYPSEMKDSQEKYPLVVMANGTGITASKYKEVFKHLASWGFIVIGNEDEHSRSGASSSASLDFILKLNSDKNSDFYGKIDTENIGIAGHSQGGVGAVNAVTAQANGNLYKAVFAASTTSSALTGVLGADWEYDISKINIPCFMVAGTGNADAGTATQKSDTEGQGICPLWSLNENYGLISDSVPKIIARQKDKDHGDMLRFADGYMTAWFMYYLKGDMEAGKAFFGESAEILSNENWQDVKVNDV